ATGEQIFDTNGSTPNRENIQLVEGGNARLTLRLSNGTANTLYGANATTVIPGRTWTHVTATYKNGSHVRLYINGTKRTDQAPVTQLIAMDQPTFIGGKGPSGQARSFNGSIDEFIIINKSLTDNQILLYYRNQSNVIHSTTTVKENWTGQVYPTDNASTGTALNASLQIVNSVANITNFFINTTDPQNRSNGTINVSFDLEDVDNDSVRYQVDWDLNTVLNKTFANQTNISPGNTSRGNNFSAVVAAFDETSWSTNQTGSVVITNTAPTPADITNPNATDIWNGTKLINWTASTDIDELDTWYYNLTLINSDNTANATIATLLSQSATNYSWNASSVKDGQFRINITTTENNTDEKFTVTNVSNLFNISTTETISAVEAAPSVSAGSSGDSGSSGGGGGEKKEKVVLGFEIDTKELQFELARGEAEEKIFTIKNTGTAPQTFALSVEGVDAMLTVVPERFVLGPGEEKVVIAYVISSDETGIFTGNVRVETDGGSKELPVVIEVESKTVLFDARLSLDPVFVALTPGDNLPVEVTLFSIGAPRNVDVELRYSLRDIYGNLLWTSSETMAVENQKTFSKDFALPGDLSDGMYVLGLEVLYLNSVATSTVTFDVLKSLDTIYGVAFFKQNFVLFLTFVVVVFVTLAGAYILYQTRNGGKRRG
ncbi:MAG TPA: LamG-like jellyroll fold domain-containing protein, partial [Candidatus Nanoarchaeia archaeon]|nr:LamG-like jellyroll fold domain-containing protein [Candidatus Nanoarchaeia archaeon]